MTRIDHFTYLLCYQHTVDSSDSPLWFESTIMLSDSSQDESSVLSQTEGRKKPITNMH